MVDKNELGKAIVNGFGNAGNIGNTAASSLIAYGINGKAVNDSVSGEVDIYIEGETCTIETEIAVYEGDEVSIRVVGGHMVVQGVISRGDEVAIEVETAKETATEALVAAETAESVASQALEEIETAASVQHMHFDEEEGLIVHESIEGDTPWNAGMNTQQANGAFNIREDTSVVASFAADKVELGKSNPDATIEFCDGAAMINVAVDDKGVHTKISNNNPDADLVIEGSGYGGGVTGQGRVIVSGGYDMDSPQLVAEQGSIGIYKSGYDINLGGTWLKLEASNITSQAQYSVLNLQKGSNFDIRTDGIAIKVRRREYSPTTSTTTELESKVDIRPEGILSNASIFLDTAHAGYFLTDKAGNSYPGIYDNGANLWIGTEARGSQHHAGGTYISAGYDPATGNPSPHLYVSIPDAGGVGGANYANLHTVASGTSGNWNYLKLSDGTAICFGTWSITTPINTAWGGMYRSSSSFAGASFPFAFNATPECFFFSRGSEAATIFASSGASVSKAPTYYIMRGASMASSETYSVMLLAIGKYVLPY